MTEPNFDADYERARSKVALEADDLEITGAVLDEMMAEPDRALSIFARVRGAAGIRNPAAFAVRLWKSRKERPPAPAPEPEPELEPPTLSAVEFLWSRPPAPALAGLERLMGAAIGAAGGCAHLLARGDFERRQRFDAVTGELQSEEPDAGA